MKKNNRRDFIKKSVKAAAGTYIATMGFSAKSYANIIGANDRVRLGVIGFALGTAGLVPVENRIGTRDLFGRALEITEVAVADEIAAAASLLMGQAAEGSPVVLIRGADIKVGDVGSGALIRAREQDLFR